VTNVTECFYILMYTKSYSPSGAFTWMPSASASGNKCYLEFWLLTY